MPKALEVQNLTKRFGALVAVDNISFSLEEGEILGLLGPNGAGKTTTIQMLLGVLTPSSGTIRYQGKDFLNNRREIAEKINFSSTYTSLPGDLTIRENLNFISKLYDIPDPKKRIEEIIELFRLGELITKRYYDLSAGQQTRVNLAKAFINYPSVLLLDEPTASLDPDVAVYIREFLDIERKKIRSSVIVASHNMAEVEELCDRVLFINHGKIIADDTPENLAKTIEVAHVEFIVSDEHSQKLLEEFCNREHLIVHRDGRRIVVDTKDREIPRLLEGLVSSGVKYDEISIERPTLEDYFLKAARS